MTHETMTGSGASGAQRAPRVPKQSLGTSILRKVTLRNLLILAATLIAVLALIVWVRMSSALTAEERQVAGSWIIDQLPGRTRVYTFTADRQFFASDLNSSGVPIGEDPPAPGESWCVQNDTLLFRRSKGGPFGLYNLIPWIHATSKWRVRSLSDDTLIVDGGPGTKPLIWKRSPTTPRRMQ
jgi:hypothetical protein